ncbi:MAG: glycosyltransferase [Caldilineaceae bacterium]
MCRVVHVATWIGRYSGGVGPVVANLAREQSQIGVTATIWSLDDRNSFSQAMSDHDLQNVIVKRYNSAGPMRLGFSWGLCQAATNNSEQFDLLHQHGVWTAISVCTNFFRASTKKPVIIAPHGSLEPVALKRSSLKKMVSSLAYETKNLHNASCLHALSAKEVNDFRAYGLKNPIAVIPNGISKVWLTSKGSRTSALEKFRLSPNRRIMLFLSRVHPKKGLVLLIKAMAAIRSHLQDWLLVIAGSDESGHRAEIESLVQKLNLGNYVCFIGPVFGQDKRDIFAACDIFVLPTFSEGAPVVVLEALGAGVPVLTTHGTPWEDLQKQACGWWVPVNENSIANALVEAVNYSPDKLQLMGQRGHKLVSNKYTWESLALKTQSVYEWLLGNQSQPDCVIND